MMGVCHRTGARLSHEGCQNTGPEDTTDVLCSTIQINFSDPKARMVQATRSALWTCCCRTIARLEQLQHRLAAILSRVRRWGHSFLHSNKHLGASMQTATAERPEIVHATLELTNGYEIRVIPVEALSTCSDQQKRLDEWFTAWVTCD